MWLVIVRVSLRKSDVEFRFYFGVFFPRKSGSSAAGSFALFLPCCGQTRLLIPPFLTGLPGSSTSRNSQSVVTQLVFVLIGF